jgi:hypothetical protein
LGAAPAVSRRWFLSPWGITLQWTGVLAPPMAWAADLTVRYALVKTACGSNATLLLMAVTVVALAVSGVGAAAAWRGLAEAPSDARTEGGQPFDRGRFMAVLGLCSSALFSVMLVAGAIPLWVLFHACQ